MYESHGNLQIRPLLDMVQVYASIMYIQMRKMLAQRATLTSIAAVWIVRIYVFRAVWSALIASGGLAGETFTVPIMTTYIVLSTLHSSLITTIVTGIIATRVRNGDIVYNLVRPTHLLLTISLEALGRDMGKTMLAVGVLLFILPFTGFQLPSSLDRLLLYIVSAALGLSISFLLYLLLGLMAFWTVRIDGIARIYVLLQNLASGTLVPLILFPKSIQVVARLSPFAMTVDIPLSIYLGWELPAPVGVILLVEVVWLALLCGVVGWVWRSLESQLQIQGG